MADLNTVVIMGRFGFNPQLKTTQNGTSFVQFSLANNQWNGKEDVGHWINCVAWGKTAEAIAKYCEKGTLIVVQGRLEQNKYTNADGIEINTYNVVVFNFNFAGGSRSTQQTNKVEEPQPQVRKYQQTYDDFDDSVF